MTTVDLSVHLRQVDNYHRLIQSIQVTHVGRHCRKCEAKASTMHNIDGL